MKRSRPYYIYEQVQFTAGEAPSPSGKQVRFELPDGFSYEVQEVRIKQSGSVNGEIVPLASFEVRKISHNRQPQDKEYPSNLIASPSNIDAQGEPLVYSLAPNPVNKSEVYHTPCVSQKYGKVLQEFFVKNEPLTYVVKLNGTPPAGPTPFIVDVLICGYLLLEDDNV